jgi:DNA-binding response OmpR family regulator
MTKILYVEDNEDTAEAVRIMLTSAGFDIELATTGREGLKKGAKGHFDLILLDYMLPDLTGWDIFESLRLKTKSKFAFLTIVPIETQRLTLMKQMGLSDYIPKPFGKQELLQRVKKIIDERREQNGKNIIHRR